MLTYWKSMCGLFFRHPAVTPEWWYAILLYRTGAVADPVTTGTELPSVDDARNRLNEVVAHTCRLSQPASGMDNEQLHRRIAGLQNYRIFRQSPSMNG